MNPDVIPWTINLSRLSDFWKPIIEVRDEQGNLVTYSNTQITIYPEGQSPIVWNPANGKLTITGPGLFAVNVSRNEIAAYTFESAPYKWSVTYTNGKVEGDWMEGIVRVSD